jgi:hypothetical protein
MRDAELDLSSASVGADRNRGWPASHAILPCDPLLWFLNQGE